jgi:hypothetical protein
MTDRQTLLILIDEDCSKARTAALRHAKSTSSPLHVIQILSSDLYRYGHQDLIATRPSKRQFLLHIRTEVLQRGRAEIENLQAAAQEIGVPTVIAAVESEDVYSVSLEEARKGYETIFLPKQETKIFPLFKKSLAAYLRKKISGRIIPC